MIILLIVLFSFLSLMESNVFNVRKLHLFLIFLRELVMLVLMILVLIMDRRNVFLILIIQIGLVLVITILQLGHSHCLLMMPHPAILHSLTIMVQHVHHAHFPSILTSPHKHVEDALQVKPSILV